jgi:hypothetical protein
LITIKLGKSLNDGYTSESESFESRESKAELFSENNLVQCLLSATETTRKLRYLHQLKLAVKGFNILKRDLTTNNRKQQVPSTSLILTLYKNFVTSGSFEGNSSSLNMILEASALTQISITEKNVQVIMIFPKYQVLVMH